MSKFQLTCEICNTIFDEPEYDSGDINCPTCGCTYGYANGYRTFMLSKKQLDILRKEWEKDKNESTRNS